MTVARGGLASTSYRAEQGCISQLSIRSPTRMSARARNVASKAAATALQFSKFHGLGNDFLLVDNRHQEKPVITPEQAVELCDRNFGVGGDGVIFALPPEGNNFDYTMRIYNSDGSEPEMCGNGLRCLAKFVAEIDGAGPERHRVHTLAGLMQPAIQQDGQVCVDMGPPILQSSRVPTTLSTNEGGAVVKASLRIPEGASGSDWSVTCVSMGNPHAVVYSRDGQDIQLDKIDLVAVGPLFEKHAVFPARTNTEFVEVLSRGHVRMTVWERGAGRTLACGTGACALVVAGVLEGRIDRSCRVDLPGGPLQIDWREADDHVLMTGPAQFVFSGTVQVSLPS